MDTPDGIRAAVCLRTLGAAARGEVVIVSTAHIAGAQLTEAGLTAMLQALLSDLCRELLGQWPHWS